MKTKPEFIPPQVPLLLTSKVLRNSNGNVQGVLIVLVTFDNLRRGEKKGETLAKFSKMAPLSSKLMTG